MNKKIIIIGILIIIAVLAGFGVFYFVKIRQAENQQQGFAYEIDFSKASNISEEQLKRLKDDYQKAKETYLKTPDNFDSLMILGFINYQLKNYDKAKGIYIKVGENSPLNYNSFWNLGNTYIKLQDYSNAEKAYLKAIENGPNLAMFYRALGELYWYNLQDKKSQIPSLYTQGLKTIPDDYDLLIGLAEYYRDTGDKTNAIKYYQQVVSKYPDFASRINEEIQNLK
jgi:tetratricopeptide (TPR) repeat protein